MVRTKAILLTCDKIYFGIYSIELFVIWKLRNSQGQQLFQVISQRWC
jgi:hypothetical protein